MHGLAVVKLTPVIVSVLFNPLGSHNPNKLHSYGEKEAKPVREIVFEVVVAEFQIPLPNSLYNTTK